MISVKPALYASEVRAQAGHLGLAPPSGEGRSHGKEKPSEGLDGEVWIREEWEGGGGSETLKENASLLG